MEETSNWLVIIPLRGLRYATSLFINGKDARMVRFKY